MVFFNILGGDQTNLIGPLHIENCTMNKILNLLLLMLFSLSGYCQFATDYKPLEATGALPNDFITLSSDKYAAQRATLKSEKGKAKKVKDQFLLESSFEIDNILLSGKVLVNDPVSSYVNKVADRVLENDKATRDKLHFYVIKTPSVNASATNQGIVFINMGLLAQLENESELAFILCHEIEHFKNKHSITRAVETDKMDRGKGSYKSFSKDEKMLATCSFTKEQESVADEKGYELFKKSKYSSAHILGAFDVLKYSYLPVDDVPFDISFFENASYKLPENFQLKVTQPINTKDEEENPKSTHPSIRARSQAMLTKINNADNAGKSDYLVGKADFESVREIARFELSKLYLMRLQYEEAIYNSYMLLKKYPANLYLKKIILESLSDLSAYAVNRNIEKAHTKPKEIEGKSQALCYLFDQMDSIKSADIAVMALAYAAKLKKEYPTDEDIDTHTKFIIKTVVSADREWDYFANIKAAITSDSLKNYDSTALTSKVAVVESDTPMTGEEDSKYAKIKKQEEVKQVEVRAGKGYYAQYALVDYYNEPWLKTYFDSASQNKLSGGEEKLVIKRKSTVSSKVYELGIDRVLVINPYYARLNANNKKKFRYLQSEDGEIDFVKRMKSNAKIAKLDVEVLDAKNLASSDANRLNDIAAMEDYIAERLHHDGDITTPYPEREKMKKLAQKYNTDYFMWSGVVSYKDYQKRKIGVAVVSSIFPFMLPFTLSYLANGGHYTYYFNMMYDVKEDKVKLVNFRAVESRTNPSILNSHIFDTFQQIKQKPKERKEKKA